MNGKAQGIGKTTGITGCEPADPLGTTEPTIAPPFESNYSMVSIGYPVGVQTYYGGLTFKYDDPNTLLIAGAAGSQVGRIYQIAVTRDGTGHITGFSGIATLYPGAGSTIGQFNDAGLAFGLAQFSRLREQWLRLNGEVFGHRLLMDCIVPGRVTTDLDSNTCAKIAHQSIEMEVEVLRLRAIYDEHAGLQDRFQAAGIVAPELAARLGLCGLAGRASGQKRDLRVDFPCSPYDQLGVRPAFNTRGDVAARIAVRFDELSESMRLTRLIVEGLPKGEVHIQLPRLDREGIGVGWVEGWRGEVMVALEADASGSVQRCHCHDPSWQNWPLLEHAILDNIVPDFPLINKSFNLSYAGHDL